MSSNETLHGKVTSFLRTIRGSFPDAAIIYRFGACYGLYQILKQVFPSARPYMTKSKEHILTKIGGRFYEILGEYVDTDGKVLGEPMPLNEGQMEYWESNVAAQRVEHMTKKYNAD
jgi:hypothetical protein